MRILETPIKLPLIAAIVLAASVMVLAQEDDQITTGNLSTAKVLHQAVAPRGHRNGQAHARFGIPDIDSLVNFNKHFQANGIDAFGNPQHIWYYNMIGNPPEMGRTTTLNAPVVPVILDLRNFDGSPRFVNGQPLISSPAPFVTPTMNSPVFQNSTFDSSSVPTQISDAVQRAEFFNSAKSDWHTLLAPAVKTTRTMVLLRGTYRFALNADGTCCFFVEIDINTFVNALFPATPTDTTTPIGAAENAGDITTKDLSTFLFPNAFLYFNGDPNQCCVIGFHSYDIEPGDASDNFASEKRFVLDYASWISPGIFSGGFQDVTALSHEVSETYNDPFVASDNIHNVTPWWLSPNGNCQDDLEVGDVIEGLPNGVYPITMNGMTYHPQNEALLQWFEFKSPSDAIDSAYSYPNVSTLTALSAPQNPGCQ
jgi:hypothetical protein